VTTAAFVPLPHNAAGGALTVHGAAGDAQHLLGDATQREPLEAADAVGAHDDQVGPGQAGQAYDLFGRVAARLRRRFLSGRILLAPRLPAR
jgi:hypothetical protein